MNFAYFPSYSRIPMKNFIIFDTNPDTFDFSILRKYLNKLGFQEFNPKEECKNKEILFLWFKFDYTYLSRELINYYYNIPIYAINILLNNDCITLKYKLYENMKNYFPNEYLNFMMPSFILNEETVYNKNDSNVYITRPIINLKTKLRASSGKDVYVYNNEDTLKVAKENLKNYDIVLVSKYITNPLLFQNKKFHLRCYLTVTIINNIFSAYFLDISRFFTAKENYKNEDFQNYFIHDTHYRYNDNDYLFPLHFTSENINKNISDKDNIHINKQIRDIALKMSIILSKKVKKLPNSKNGFHVFGFDVMIDDNLKVKLLECNRYLDFGFDYNREYGKIFEKYFFNWIIEIVIKPLYNIKLDYKNLNNIPILQFKR